MDQQKLRMLVFEKTGVKIDIDDPIFALVALNEAVLAEAVERHVALLDDATADLADQAQGLRDNGSICRFAQGGAAAPAALPTAATAATVTNPALAEQRIMLIAGASAVLCAVLVLGGQALLFRPAPVAPPTIVAKELTPDQAQAIRNGEKMAQIVQKLDPKTRNAIQAEMQKP